MKLLAALFALGGAALLFARVGDALGAEIGYTMIRNRTELDWWSLGAMWVCVGCVPATLCAAVYAGLRHLTEKSARQLAIAAGVGFFFLLPSVLHWLGLRPGPAPSAPWAIAGYLVYRFLFSAPSAGREHGSRPC